MPPRPPVRDEVLAEFEAKNHLYLPADFREYLRRCNGCNYDDWHDSHDEVGDVRGLMEFFPFETMELIRGTEGTSATSDLERVSAYLCFADYLIGSHLYGIRLSSDPAALTPVVAWFGPSDLLQVASSFTEFVGIYVNEPKRLLPYSKRY